MRLPEVDGGAYLGEEVVALVIDDDEGGEVLDLDAPYGFHAEFFVLEHFDLPYPTLRADRATASALGARGYPTVVILDQAGVLRMVKIGHAPTLREDLGAMINELLSEGPTAP